MLTAELPTKKTRSVSHGNFYVQVAAKVTTDYVSEEIVADHGQMRTPKWPQVLVGDLACLQGRYFYDYDGSKSLN